MVVENYFGRSLLSLKTHVIHCDSSSNNNPLGIEYVIVGKQDINIYCSFINKNIIIFINYLSSI